jgi:hypothetical protein
MEANLPPTYAERLVQTLTGETVLVTAPGLPFVNLYLIFVVISWNNAPSDNKQL